MSPFLPPPPRIPNLTWSNVDARAPQGHGQVSAVSLSRSVGRWTVHEFQHGVARMGSFPARKSDGERGSQADYRCWQKLDL